MKTHTLSSLKRGFTLVESVIALGILVVLITGFLAVFGPAAETIRKTLSIDEASRLQSSLEYELTHLRDGGEKQRYQDDPFRKALDWISQSHESDTTILVYKYKALPGQIRTDGSLEPAEQVPGIAGKDFILQPMARRINDRFLEADLAVTEGRVFFVKLRQLIYQGEGIRVSEEIGTIVDPHDPGENFANNPEEYPEAIVAFEAEYYTLPTTSYQFLSGTFDPDNYTRPIFSRNLSVRR
ncbi:prepilin-type N-terminal cleavage/methylation domain-containing protein [Verrucomicrobiaceae bacterium 227]